MRIIGLESARRRRNKIFARKQLILRRAITATQWHQLFPQHDFSTGRLRLRQLTPPRGWNEGWRAAARAYHKETERNQAIPTTWPTPQVTIEAIMLAVREHGIAALKFPENVERLRGCDGAAKAQIDGRILELKKLGRIL